MADVPSPRSSRWPDVQTLQAEFPSISLGEIGHVLLDARRSVELFGLSREDEAVMVEKIAMEELRQRTGESSAGGPARLDPERHRRRSQPPSGSVDPTTVA
jgi:hypothetical protein